MKKVLITGVAGFIGSHLLEYLLDNSDWDITGIDNLSTGSMDNIEKWMSHSRFHFQALSCKDLKSLKDYEVVFHLAALPRIQPSFEYIIEHIEANLLQAMHLIELMIQDAHYPRFVYSGSSAIYGTPEQIPTPETEKVDCLSPYAFQKYEVEKYMALIATRYPLNYVTLRYFNPYGPRSFNDKNPFNAYSSVVGIFLNRKQKGLPLLITGNGSQERDFIHVKDLAAANYKAAIHPDTLNDAFNVGFGATLSILKMAQMISDNYDFIPKREGEAEITFADISKTKRVLGWQPTHRLEKYLAEALAENTTA